MNVMRSRAWSSLGGSLFVAITLSACGTLPATTVDKRCDRAAVDSGNVQSFQRQIREREKRIAELESQLDVLKTIDQDMEKRRSPAGHPRR